MPKGLFAPVVWRGVVLVSALQVYDGGRSSLRYARLTCYDDDLAFHSPVI